MVEPIESTIVESAHIRKVVLWGDDDVLSQAIGHIFGVNMTWEVSRVQKKEDVGDLIEEIKRINPDVVILRDDRVDENSSLPLRLLNEQLCPKVISLGLGSNLVQVYSKQEIILEGISDLLSIVESSYFPKHISEKEVGPKKQDL